jgi:uncharacterized repeat protein (TIGR03803 family)
MATRILATSFIGCIAGITAIASAAYAGASATSGGAAFARLRAGVELRDASSGYIESVDHAFAGPPDGAVPGGFDNLVLDDAGNLYGTTTGGGSASCNCGTVFKLTPSTSGYAETILLTFNRVDGSSPQAGLLAVKHALFGTALGGSSISDGGVVFELSPARTGYRETIVHQFSGNRDGFAPAGALALGARGVLFGMTSGGGRGKRGTVFKLAPSGTGYVESIIYDFPSSSGGRSPSVR